MNISEVPKVILVASGKGGVGKTTVAADLAHAADDIPGAVGLIDADISTPNSIGVLADGEADIAGQRLSTRDSLIPPTVNGIQAVSHELLLPDDVPVNRDAGWRTEQVLDYIQNVNWANDTHTIIIDSPPGTGSEVQTVVTEVPISRGLVVTTPHDSSELDARRSQEMLSQFEVPTAGVLNMAYIPGDAIAGHVATTAGFTAVDGVGEETESALHEVMAADTDDFPLFGYEDGWPDIGTDIEAVVPYTEDSGDRREALRPCLPSEEVSA